MFPYEAEKSYCSAYIRRAFDIFAFWMSHHVKAMGFVFFATARSGAEKLNY